MSYQAAGGAARRRTGSRTLSDTRAQHSFDAATNETSGGPTRRADGEGGSTWRETKDGEGRTYWFCAQTRAVSWADPHDPNAEQLELDRARRRTGSRTLPPILSDGELAELRHVVKQRTDL